MTDPADVELKPTILRIGIDYHGDRRDFHAGATLTVHAWIVFCGLLAFFWATAIYY